MESYQLLYRIITEHDYFNRRPRTILKYKLTPQGRSLAQQRGLLFREVDLNEWELLYDTEGAGVDTANDVLELELIIADTDFALYTEWKDFYPSAAYRLELPLAAEENDATTLIRLADGKRKVGSPFCTVQLHLTEKLIEAAKAGTPEVCRLHFHTPKRHWQFLFKSRTDDDRLEGGELQLEDATGMITFGKFYKTQFCEQEYWCTESIDSIPLRSTYECRLRLVVQEEDSPRRILLKKVELPELGRFQSGRIDYIQQICYY